MVETEVEGAIPIEVCPVETAADEGFVGDEVFEVVDLIAVEAELVVLGPVEIIEDEGFICDDEAFEVVSRTAKELKLVAVELGITALVEPDERCVVRSVDGGLDCTDAV